MGGDTKIKKKGGGKLGQGVGALKRGAGTPLRTMTRRSIFERQCSETIERQFFLKST